MGHFDGQEMYHERIRRMRLEDVVSRYGVVRVELQIEAAELLQHP